MTAEEDKVNELTEDVYEILKDTLDVNTAFTYCRHVVGRICDELMLEHRTNGRYESYRFWSDVKHLNYKL